MCNAFSVEAYEKDCSKRIILSAVTTRNCVVVAPIQARDGSSTRAYGKLLQKQQHNTTKIYGSEKALFDAASGAPSFHRMNGYGSKNEAFFFCRSASIRETWFAAAWKSYESGPFHCYASVAAPLAPL